MSIWSGPPPALQWLEIPHSMCSYGQARRKGRMLVAKLDFLQYIIVRSFLGNVAAKARGLWNSVRDRVAPGSSRKSSGGVAFRSAPTCQQQ